MKFLKKLAIVLAFAFVLVGCKTTTTTKITTKTPTTVTPTTITPTTVTPTTAEVTDATT